ncbi:MAG: hypothetical protein QM662_04010 [Gordonia sp. (in: high G+C Gram-positive bacteria)]
MSPTAGLSSAPTALSRIDPRALSHAITEEILAGEHAYVESALPADLLEAVVCDNVAALLATIDGAPLDLTPARRAGRVKAEAGIPLAGVMHAYRIAGLRLWREIGVLLGGRDNSADQFFDLGSQAWSVLDLLSTAAAEAHREVTDARGRCDEQARIAAARDILEGVTAPERREQAARTLGMAEPGRFLVVAVDRLTDDDARPSRPAEPALATVQWVDLGGVRMGLAALAPNTASPAPWPADPEVRVGISTEFVLLHEAPEAARQAAVALRCVPRGQAGRSRYGERPVETLVVSQPQAAREVADHVLGRSTLSPMPTARSCSRPWKRGSTATAPRSRRVGGCTATATPCSTGYVGWRR